MRVLVGCEYSGIVRQAFDDAGHDAMSCDFLDTEIPGAHYKGDIFSVLVKGFDLIILHPPCTHMAVCGNRYWSGTKERQIAVAWTRKLWNTAIRHADRVALENPVSVLSSEWQKPTQYIQPWQFGHGETKKTGLWLHNLPPLVPTNIVEGREQRIWKMSPSPDRGKERSRFYPGIAAAMAQQWSES